MVMTSGWRAGGCLPVIALPGGKVGRLSVGILDDVAVKGLEGSIAFVPFMEKACKRGAVY